MSFKDDMNIFKEKICTYCKNDECERGIVAIRHKDELQMKCCEFIRKDNNKQEQKELIEFMKYCKSKTKKRKEV